MASTPEIGAPAPDFTLPGIVLSGSDVERRDFTLSASRGKPIVLAFYPGDAPTRRPPPPVKEAQSATD
jgi:thioredoxin-dependent peroxiredoxin